MDSLAEEKKLLLALTFRNNVQQNRLEQLMKISTDQQALIEVSRPTIPYATDLTSSNTLSFHRNWIRILKTKQRIKFWYEISYVPRNSYILMYFSLSLLLPLSAYLAYRLSPTAQQPGWYKLPMDVYQKVLLQLNEMPKDQRDLFYLNQPKILKRFELQFQKHQQQKVHLNSPISLSSPIMQTGNDIIVSVYTTYLY